MKRLAFRKILPLAIHTNWAEYLDCSEASIEHYPQCRLEYSSNWDIFQTSSP